MKMYSLLIPAIILTINFENCHSENFELLILHNNDMHGRFEETSLGYGTCKEENKKLRNCVGGFVRVAHVIREARRAAEEGKGPNVLYLNAGDTYIGSTWFSIPKAKIVVEFLNLLQPDAASFGNHEFDDGLDGVTPYIKGINFPVLAANLDFSNTTDYNFTKVLKSTILEVAGRKIGVIGYLTPETAHMSAPETVIFKDEVASIKEESERLEKEGVKIIVALGHSGFETDKKIGREVPLVDLVVGGHTNTFLWNGPEPDSEQPVGVYPTVVEQSSGKKVPVVQAFAFTKYMGHLHINFDEEGNAVEYYGQPLFLNQTVPEDQDVLDALNKYRPEVDAWDDDVLGRSRVVLNGSCRYKECNFGNMITDSFVAYHASHYGGPFWTDAPIGIINGGAIRNSIVPNKSDGNITRGELLGALPYDNTVITMTLNGTHLLKTLEIGVRNNGETSGGELLQVSGIRYRFDVSKPVGSRIVEAEARCGLCSVQVYEPIVPYKTYRVITTEFLNNGGDNHTVIRNNGYNKFPEDMTDVNIVEWYMKKFTPISAEEEGRLIVQGRDGSLFH